MHFISASGHTPRALVACAVALATLAQPTAGADPDPARIWRDATIVGGPADREEPSHPEAMHEWWYFTVQNAAGGDGCGPWQAMVTFLSDREVAKDMLLFTAVLEGAPIDRTREFAPGTIRRSVTDAGPGIEVELDGSVARGRTGHWEIEVSSGDAHLSLWLDATQMWRRRAPEGGGLLEITFAPRAIATGSLRVGARECAVTGAGYYEHVWGTWSRAPMWGVDYLNVHLENGWSLYVRRTPMRGETNLYPAIGQDAAQYWPPVLVASDGARMFEAQEVTVKVSDSDDSIPELAIKKPGRYEVAASAFTAPQGGRPPQTVELVVTDVVLATILLPTTSSGILEGWGAVQARIDGGAPVAGTSEVEVQRYGTRYPH